MDMHEGPSLNLWPDGWSLWPALRRDTADGSFIPVIDGLRFIAIMAVVLYHLQDYVVVKTGRSGSGDWLALLMGQGYIGVQLFFAISGFIIARPFLNGTAPGLKRYFVRRLTRLEPPYLINLLLVYILLVAVLGANPIALLPHLLASALYLHNILFGGMSEINFLAWSLEVEFQFYVLAPALLAGLIALGVLWRRLALLLLVIAGGWAYRSDPLGELGVGATLIGYFGFFAAGIFAAEIYVGRWRERPPLDWSWDVVALVGWAGLLVALLVGTDNRPMLPICILLAILGSLGGRWSARILGCEPVYVIGGMCYTLYLYHFLTISAVGRFVLPWLGAAHPLWFDLLIAGAIIIPIVLAAGTALFLVTEKPFMRWRREGRRLDPNPVPVFSQGQV